MSNFKKCPECAEEVRLMPERKPLETSVETGTFPMVTTVTGDYAGGTWTGPNYGPTSRIYKCSNPKCWVTKITESWE